MLFFSLRVHHATFSILHWHRHTGIQAAHVLVSLQSYFVPVPPSMPSKNLLIAFSKFNLLGQWWMDKRELQHGFIITV
jgi:hypothetical protein